MAKITGSKEENLLEIRLEIIKIDATNAWVRVFFNNDEDDNVHKVMKVPLDDIENKGN